MAATVALVAALLCVASRAAAQGQGPIPCEGACPDITYQHYFAKGCEAVFDNEVDACCPVSFNCSVAEAERTKDSCYYNGVAYALGEEMPVSNPCEKHCKCGGFGDWPRANCAFVECPSLFNPALRECKETHTLDSCCPELSECPAESGIEDPEVTTVFSTRDDGSATPPPEFTCEYEDQVYTLGEKFYPDNEPCRVCVCSETFAGDVYGPSCRQIECGMDYRDRQELETGCTPIYFNRRCCQIDWICPDSDRLSPTPEQTATGDESPLTHCTLGTTIAAPVNATLATTSDNLRCFCSTPPDFTCIQYSSAADAQVAAAENKRGVL